MLGSDGIYATAFEKKEADTWPSFWSLEENLVLEEIRVTIKSPTPVSERHDVPANQDYTGEAEQEVIGVLRSRESP